MTEVDKGTPVDLSADGCPFERCILHLETLSTDDCHELFFPCCHDILQTMSLRLSTSATTEPYGSEKSQSILTSWASAKYTEKLVQQRSNKEYETLDSEASTDSTSYSPPLEPLTSLVPATFSLSEPVYSTPARVCTSCETPILTTLTVAQLPGYCEYTGAFICGECFHDRLVVIPWKLADGYESYRGKVSRAAAEIIHANFYSLCIDYSRVSSLPIMRSVHSMRLRCQVYREKIRTCCHLRESIMKVLSPLPAHFRNELISTDSDFAHTPSLFLDYCLADLVDIVGGSSIIGRTFLACLEILDAHACASCEERYTRTCSVCIRNVSSTDIEWTYCDECGEWFHRKCLSRCCSGCPVCANRITPVPVIDIFPLSDSLVI